MIRKHQSGETTSYSISSKKKKLPGKFSEERTARYALQFCEHTLQMFEDVINVGEKRLITSVDLRKKTRLCFNCSLAKAKSTVLGEKP